MTSKKDILKGFLIMFITVVVFGAAMFGLNIHTAPLIESGQLSFLKDVMPDGTGFELIYDANNAASSTLTDVAEDLIVVYKETSGKGYVFRAKATSQYSKQPMEFTVGVTADGKISGLLCDVYTESQELLPSFLPSFIGKDSALADVEVTGGTTYSSKAIKTAVENSLACLIANGLITEGVKGPEQILTELIPSVHAGLATIDGTLKCEKEAGSGNILTIYKGENGAGFAYIMTKGEGTYLAVTNNLGACKVYDVEGADVTALHSDLVESALAHTAANGTSYVDSFTSRVKSMMSGADNFNTLTVDAYNTVVTALSFELEGATYYAFYSKSFGYEVMDVYYILDSEGKIVKMSAQTFIFDEEYFFAFAGLPSGYISGFNGLTSETFNGEQAIIATATLSSNGMKQATYDIFAAYKATQNGGAN